MKTLKTLTVLSVIIGLAMPALAQTGNGAPNGAHFTLNLIGVPKDKEAEMTADDGNCIGHRIFVPLYGNPKIWLFEAGVDEPEITDFCVIDANGTDNDGASLVMPNPDPDNDGVTVYSVFARALGTPGGNGTITTCAEVLIDPDGIPGSGDEYLEEVCSIYYLYLERTSGPSKFVNASKELLYIYVDLDGDGIAERYNLFNDALQGYFWDYDNNGLKVVQLRFYEVPTDVEALP